MQDLNSWHQNYLGFQELGLVLGDLKSWSLLYGLETVLCVQYLALKKLSDIRNQKQASKEER